MNKELQNFIDRIERLDAEKDVLSADIRDLYQEANRAGHDAKAMRIVIRRRKMERREREELDSIVAIMEAALEGEGR